MDGEPTVVGGEEICAPVTDHFISVSNIISRKAIAAGIDRPEKFSTVYSGMELDWFLKAQVNPLSIRLEFGIPEDSLVVGKIARLFSLKGHDQLMDAASEIVRRHPTVRFFLVGDGVLYDHLRTRARALGILDNFIFAGLVPRERIPEMISVMDVLVHTSLREGLARVLPQALAMGKPCVSFDIDGAPEVVIHRETGYLVKPAITRAWPTPSPASWPTRSLAPGMGEAGRRVVDPAFRAETMVSEIAGIYDMLRRRHAERLARFERRGARGVSLGLAPCAGASSLD